MKILITILILFFTASAFAEVVEVPPVRQTPNNGVEETLGERSSGEWKSSPLEQKKAGKKSSVPNSNLRSSCPAPAPPPATSLYGDPTRGFVHNRSNFFIRGWWANSGNGKPGSAPLFELAPGFIWEGQASPGGMKWLYIEAISATGTGAAPVGWKTFEIQLQNQPLIWGWYGWQVYVNSGDFPYFTGTSAPNWRIP